MKKEMQMVVENGDVQQIANIILREYSLGIKRAAKIFVAFRDAGGDVEALIAASDMDRGIWKLLEQIGDKKAYAGIVGYIPTIRGLLLGLSVSEQKAVCLTGVEVLQENGSVVRVPVNKMTVAEGRQVFDERHIRTIEQQKDYIEENKIRLAAAMAGKEAQSASLGSTKSYCLRDGKLIVKWRHEFDEKSAKEMMAEYESHLEACRNKAAKRSIKAATSL